MLYAFLLVMIVVLFYPSAHAIWYAKSGRYELDRRLDQVAKR